MLDLRILVADGTTENVVKTVLQRHRSLGIPTPFHNNSRVIVHSERDPGVYHRGHELLSASPEARYTLVILDSDWEGAPSANTIRSDIIQNLGRIGVNENESDVIVIEPELEKWIWVIDNSNFLRIINWNGSSSDLRNWLLDNRFEIDAHNKPTRPKEALEAVLRYTGRPFSSAIHKEIAEVVSLQNCVEPTFLLFKNKLNEWFGL